MESTKTFLEEIIEIMDYLGSEMNTNHSKCEYSHGSYHYDKDTNEHVMIIQAPGFKKEDIDIEVNKMNVIVKGKITDEHLKSKLNRTEFEYILRKKDIDPDKVEAKLENGILTIKMLNPEYEKGKKVEIK